MLNDNLHVIPPLQQYLPSIQEANNFSLKFSSKNVIYLAHIYKACKYNTKIVCAVVYEDVMCFCISSLRAEERVRTIERNSWFASVKHGLLLQATSTISVISVLFLSIMELYTLKYLFQ